MHLRQNQQCFQGILPDQELYDPAIAHLIRKVHENYILEYKE
jgi:hypothetical protein